MVLFFACWFNWFSILFVSLLGMLISLFWGMTETGKEEASLSSLSFFSSILETSSSFELFSSEELVIEDSSDSSSCSSLFFLSLLNLLIASCLNCSKKFWSSFSSISFSCSYFLVFLYHKKILRLIAKYSDC